MNDFEAKKKKDSVFLFVLCLRLPSTTGMSCRERFNVFFVPNSNYNNLPFSYFSNIYVTCPRLKVTKVSDHVFNFKIIIRKNIYYAVFYGKITYF